MKKAVFILIIIGVLMVSADRADAGIIPQYSETTLSNGLRIVLVEDHRLPMVDFRLSFNIGSASDPEGLNGLGIMTVDMLLGGTVNYPGEKLRESIDSIGGQVDAYIRRNNFGLIGYSLSRDIDYMITLLADMVINPELSVDYFDITRRRLVSLIMRNESIVNYDLTNSLFVEHFNDVGFGPSSFGTYEGVDNISLSDIKNHYEKNIRANNAVLVLAGDFDSEKIKKALKEKFGLWTRGSDFTKPAVHLKQVDSLKIIILDDADAMSTEFMMGAKVPSILSDTAAQLFLLDYILGSGGGTSRLNRCLIEEHNLATTVSSRIYWFTGPGLWTISGTANNEIAADAIGEVLKVIKDLREMKIPLSELNDARNFYKGVFPGYFETTRGTVDRFASLAENGLPLDYYEDLLKRFEKVSPGDLRNTADQYLDESRFIIVVNGPAEILKGALSAYGDVEEIDEDYQ